MLSLEVVPEGGERRARLDELRERGRGESSSTILITHHARPLLDFVSPTERRGFREIIEERLVRELDHQSEQQGGGELACGWTAELALDADEDCRVTATTLAREVRELWVDRLARPGLVLEGIYPLIGSPIAALDEEDAEGPLLALQIEERAVAVLEVAGGSPCSIEIHDSVRPTARLCAELVGTACPEVLLCGGGPDLARLGYEIARTSGTWVRILRPRRSLTFEEPPPANLAAILGAANHAFGLAHGGAVACVPPRG